MQNFMRLSPARNANPFEAPSVQREAWGVRRVATAKPFSVWREACGVRRAAVAKPFSVWRVACGVRRNSISAFTLIELLTVMAIIAILAGLVVGISSIANRNAIESRTRAEIKAMETALETYKADYGAYPPLDQAVWDNSDATKGGITNIFPSGVSAPTVAGAPNTNGWLNIHYVFRALSGTNTPKTYMSFLPKQLKAATNSSGYVYTMILDPNGNPYGYNPINPSGNPQTYDLWSAGIDGKSAYPTNTAAAVDDLGNWQR